MTVDLSEKSSPRRPLAFPVDFDSLQRLVVRFLCCVFTYQWYWHSVRWDFDPSDRFSLKNVILIGPFVFVVWNLGLFLSTTKWGERHKALTAILMLPSLFASPLVVGWGTSISGLFVFSVYLVSYWRIMRARDPN